MTWNRQRTYATLVGLGIWILLFKTIVMLTDGSLTAQMVWVSALLVLEFLVDAGVFLSAVWWWLGGTASRARLPLRLTVAAILVHALRVLIYVLGRTGPWHNFDFRPEHRAGVEADWVWVVFAGAMSALSLIVLVTAWLRRRRRVRS
ncbi:MYXO-CTERM sorting domain-containing protein [Candidatus Bipolaricaulota bacterium]